MPKTKLDVCKDIFNIKSDGETLLQVSKLISEELAGKYEFIDDEFLTEIGIQANTSRAKIIEIVTKLAEPGNPLAFEMGQRKARQIIESRREEGIIFLSTAKQRFNDEAPEWFQRIMGHIKEFCEEPFYDRQ